MAGIFISYRRSDAGGWAGRLSDCLKGELGRVEIFRDIEDIPPGVEFDRYINEAVSSCDVLIALIGPTWLTVKNKNGERRLDNPEDFTRLEIEAALKRNVRVIPALVGDAKIPSMDQLPEGLKLLARRQSYELSDTRWLDDCKKLAEVLKPLVHTQSWFTATKVKTVLAALLLLAVVSYGGTVWFDKKEAAEQTKIELQEKERAAEEKAAADRAAADKAVEDKAVADKAAADKAAADRAAAKRAAAATAAADKVAAERAAAVKAAADKAAADKAAADKAAARRAAAIKARAAAKKATLERMRTLHKTGYIFPGDGTPNKNKSIGPFCCTGETAVVMNRNKGRAGYIYFTDFKGRFKIGSNSSGATHLGVMVSGRSDLTDAKARQTKSTIWFSARELKRGASRSARAGGLRFKVTILSAKQGRSATKGTYYVMGSVKVKVDVSVI